MISFPEALFLYFFSRRRLLESVIFATCCLSPFQKVSAENWVGFSSVVVMVEGVDSEEVEL